MVETSHICIDLCKGQCCNPWWGIISYGIRKEKGLSNLTAFREELIKGINERAKRIIDRYITREPVPQYIFDLPERYSVSVEDIHINGHTLLIQIRAMFAFRCRFFSNDNKCLIHPEMSGGKDIRPEHCAYLGSPEAKPGERGFCRILYTAATLPGDENTLGLSIGKEKEISNIHYRQGYSSPEEAADFLLTEIKSFCTKNAPYLLPRERQIKVGRNDPCYCGSGKKYKKCHGL